MDAWENPEQSETKVSMNFFFISVDCFLQLETRVSLHWSTVIPHYDYI